MYKDGRYYELVCKCNKDDVEMYDKTFGKKNKRK